MMPLSMIYDCFTFFNELDLLEIRLNILNDVIDRFVLVEGTRTFSNNDKPLYFQENKERFRKFEKKIIHIIVDDFPPFESAWEYEFHQRNAIARGLRQCKDRDVILISDIDEIPNPEKILKYKGYSGVSVFKQKMFYYYLNNLDIKEPYWSNVIMLKYSEFVKNGSNPQKTRHLRGRIINTGGWHFSYLGGAEKIAEKIKSFSHQELNSSEYTDLIKIKNKVEKGEDLYSNKERKRYAGIKIDEIFPKYILDNKTKYKHLICEVNLTLYNSLVLLINKIKSNILVYIKNYIFRNHINSANYKNKFMKYDLVIAYRICPKMSKNPADFFDNKFELAKFSLESFKKSLEGLSVKLYALLDNCPREYETLFTDNFKKENLEIIHTNLGNKGTFKKQIEILSNQNESEIVYFAEDDYFYIKNIKSMIDFVKSGKADFVTPYEHPACYTDGHVIKNIKVIFNGQKYLTVQHACLTFMTTKKNLRANKRYLQIFSNWFGSDFVVWGCITLGTTYFNYLKSLLNFKNYSLINLKVFGSMFFFAIHRFIFNKKYKLFMPVGSFATHMEKDQLAPGIDWNKYFK